jgi:hypothetical protein
MQLIQALHLVYNLLVLNKLRSEITETKYGSNTCYLAWKVSFSPCIYLILFQATSG